MNSFFVHDSLKFEIADYEEQKYVKNADDFSNISAFFVSVNSSINFVLYCLLNKKFRGSFINMLKSCHICQLSFGTTVATRPHGALVENPGLELAHLN